MTDTPKPSQEASEAWQDVKLEWFTHPVFGYPAKKVERARAADAQQIATQQLELQSVANFTDDLKQQIAALRAENEQLQQQLDEWVKAYGQQAALREEPHND